MDQGESEQQYSGILVYLLRTMSFFKQVDIFLRATNENAYVYVTKSRHIMSGGEPIDGDLGDQDSLSDRDSAKVKSAHQRDRDLILLELARSMSPRHLDITVRLILGGFSSKDIKISQITAILDMASQLQRESCSLLITSSLFHLFPLANPLMAHFTLRRSYTFKHHLLVKLSIWRGMGAISKFLEAADGQGREPKEPLVAGSVAG